MSLPTQDVFFPELPEEHRERIQRFVADEFLKWDEVGNVTYGNTKFTPESRSACNEITINEKDQSIYDIGKRYKLKCRFNLDSEGNLDIFNTEAIDVTNMEYIQVDEITENEE